MVAASFAACDEMNQLLIVPPALTLSMVLMAVLVALTGYGLYAAFGPPARHLSDPFDDHED